MQHYVTIERTWKLITKTVIKWHYFAIARSLVECQLRVCKLTVLRTVRNMHIHTVCIWDNDYNITSPSFLFSRQDWHRSRFSLCIFNVSSFKDCLILIYVHVLYMLKCSCMMSNVWKSDILCTYLFRDNGFYCSENCMLEFQNLFWLIHFSVWNKLLVDQVILQGN